MYKTEFKLQIVNSFLAGEGGAKLLARRWSVPEKKIRTWVSRYSLHGIELTEKECQEVHCARAILSFNEESLYNHGPLDKRR